jgi:hypothetical protein
VALAQWRIHCGDNSYDGDDSGDRDDVGENSGDGTDGHK